MVAYAARSAPQDSVLIRVYCANCGKSLLVDEDDLPDLCPACRDLTTWLQHEPGHLRRRLSEDRSRPR